MSWPIECIGSVADVLPGFAFKSSELGELGTAVLKIGNIKDDGTVDTERAQRLSPERRLERHAKYELTDRDIIIAMTGATAGKAGRIRARDEEVFLLNQRVAKFCPNWIGPDYPEVGFCHGISESFTRLQAEGQLQPIPKYASEGASLPISRYPNKARVGNPIGL
ncbi:MAG: hypothetical protein IPN50_00665 [Sphingomonadales bacterium]|nr:hypothetical protein [Sphingomonadales bacterium]